MQARLLKNNYIMKKTLLTALAAVLLAACSSEPGKVKVDGGWIQGTVTEDLTIYKGIPWFFRNLVEA